MSSHFGAYFFIFSFFGGLTYIAVALIETRVLFLYLKNHQGDNDDIPKVDDFKNKEIVNASIRILREKLKNNSYRYGSMMQIKKKIKKLHLINVMIGITSLLAFLIFLGSGKL